MKLKSAEFFGRIKATYTQLKSVASFADLSRIVAAAQTGNFIVFAALFDNFYVNDGAGASDGAVLDFFKTLTDDAGAADDATNAFMKALADHAALSDGIDFIAFGKNFQNPSVVAEAYTAHIQKHLGDAFEAADDAAKLHPNKVLSDTNTVADAINTFEVGLAKVDSSLAADLSQHDFGKNAADAANLADAYRYDGSKALADGVYATDDVDGAASILDDQEIQFIKQRANLVGISDVLERDVAFVRGFADDADTTDQLATGLEKPLSDSPIFAEAYASALARTFSDSFGATDLDVLNFGKCPSDTTSFTDAGSLLSQGFTSDPTYFAEDFVGASRTFT